MASTISSYVASGNNLAGNGNIQINGPIMGNVNFPSTHLAGEQKKRQDECYTALFLTHPGTDKEGICSRNGNPVKSSCQWIREVKEIRDFEEN